MKAGLRRSRGVFLDFGSHRDDKKKWGGQRSALSFLSIFTKACTTGIIKGVSIFILYLLPGSLVGSTSLKAWAHRSLEARPVRLCVDAPLRKNSKNLADVGAFLTG
jgi:hypothetical protein